MWLRRNSLWLVLVVTFILCASFIYLYYKQFGSYPKSNDPSDWADFGSYIGGIIGSIVGFGTVVFIILTLQSQNKIKNDTFFFALLQLNERHMDSLMGEILNIEYQGRKYHRKLLEQCRIIYHTHHNDKNKVAELLISCINNLSSYLTNLREIVNFINSSHTNLLRPHSISYKNVFLAQFTNGEKIIIGYLCALNILHPGDEICKFYKKNKMHEQINYEDNLDSKILRPDAIKEILEELVK